MAKQNLTRTTTAPLPDLQAHSSTSPEKLLESITIPGPLEDYASTFPGPLQHIFTLPVQLQFRYTESFQESVTTTEPLEIFSKTSLGPTQVHSCKNFNEIWCGRCARYVFFFELLHTTIPTRGLLEILRLNDATFTRYPSRECITKVI